MLRSVVSLFRRPRRRKQLSDASRSMGHKHDARSHASRRPLRTLLSMRTASHSPVVPSEAEGPLFRARLAERNERSLRAALRDSVETTEGPETVFTVIKVYKPDPKTLGTRARNARQFSLLHVQALERRRA